jgi:hypothetical protein
MSEPSAIWSSKLIVFDSSISLTQNVILSHGRSALQALINGIDRLHHLVAMYPQFADLHPHPEIPSTLSELGFQQGVASTILFNDGPKGTRENSTTYKLRLARVDYVKDKCKNTSVSVLPNKKIRNSLTHIDEYLARDLAKPKTGWFIDSAIPRRDQFTADQHGIQTAFCRTYISSEDVILHLDNEISLKSLREEANGVLGAIWGEPHAKASIPTRRP